MYIMYAVGKQDDSTGETHYDRSKSNPSWMERNTRRARSFTPDDLDDELVVDSMKSLRVQQRKNNNHLSSQD